MDTINKFSGSEENYKKFFKEDQIKEAIDVALDIRKFEIDLIGKGPHTIGLRDVVNYLTSQDGLTERP